MVMVGELSIGNYVAYAGMVVYIIFPMRNLGRVIVQMSTGLVSYDRIAEIIRADREDLREGEPAPVSNIQGAVSFKHVNFEYEKGQSFLNENFMSRSKVPYGDLYYELDNDGTDYSIKLPFETLLHSKFTGTNLQLGYALKPSFIPYIPKPIILYDYGTTQTVSAFKFNDGSSTANVTTANIFGQDTLISSEIYTLNFGAEQSTYTNNVENQSLFINYYEAYLTNIFSQKSRIFKVKAILPISLLTQIKVNDRVIIRDKRYTINTFTTDLTTGEVSLELLTDFRAVW